MNRSHFTFSLSCFAFLLLLLLLLMFFFSFRRKHDLPRPDSSRGSCHKEANWHCPNTPWRKSGKIKALCFSLVKQRQRKQKRERGHPLTGPTHVHLHMYCWIHTDQTIIDRYTWRKKDDTGLVQVFVFCNRAQSCKQTMAWLEMSAALRPSILLLCFFFFVCLSGDISGFFFFTDVPEESMQNVNRIDCQQ